MQMCIHWRNEYRLLEDNIQYIMRCLMTGIVLRDALLGDYVVE